MMNYKFIVAYKGTNYAGWAIQKNQLTIQEMILKAFLECFKVKVSIIGSGRTDKYVHAYAQVFNIKTEEITLDPINLLNAINTYLPNDIILTDCEIVDNKFHARFNAVAKTYIYHINTNNIFDIFNQEIIYQYCKPINVNLLNDLKKVFLGKHNFLSFSTSEIKDTVRIIDDIEISESSGIVSIKIKGNGFLRNMVRMIVGVMLAYNENKINLSDIKNLLNNPSKGKAIWKAPGCGLYLLKVDY